MEDCTSIGASAKFILNALVHLVVMVATMSLFFHFVIAPRETKGTNDDMNTYLANATADIMKQEPAIGPLFSMIHRSEAEGLADMAKEYDGNPSPLVKQWNAWLFRSNAAVWIMLVFAMLMAFALLAVHDNTLCPALPTTFVENMMAFVLVFSIEVLYFNLIETHYTATKPSEFFRELKRSLVRKL